MYRNLSINLLLLLFLSLNAQALPGDLDPGFGGSGVVSTPFNHGEALLQTVVQADGKILVGGYTEALGRTLLLMRFNSDGSLDTTFASNGIYLDADAASEPSSLSLQADGKILYSRGGSMVRLTRLNPDGSLDSGFANNGVATIDLGTRNFTPVGLYVQEGASGPSGFILGGTLLDNGTGYLAVMRLDGNGNLDTSFGTNGIGQKGTTTGNLQAHAMELDASGQLVVVGSLFVTAGSQYNLAASLFTTAGSVSTGFGTSGLLTINQGANEIGRAVARDSNGLLYLLGETGNGGTSNDLLLIRLTSSGSLDTSWDTDGILVQNINALDFAVDLVIDSNDRPIVSATTASLGQLADWLLLRYETNGVLSSTGFGTNGIVQFTAEMGTVTYNRALARQADGKLLLTGHHATSVTGNGLIFRLNADGSTDTSFNTTGKTIADVQPQASTMALSEQPDGKILAAAQLELAGVQALGTYRLNTDGSTDTAFAAGAGRKTYRRYATQVEDLTLQSDGRFIVAGAFTDGNTDPAFLIRYNADGNLADTSFGYFGTVYADWGTGQDRVLALSLQSDGKLLVAGASANGGSNDLVVARYLNDGSLDTGFNSSGLQMLDQGGDDQASAILQANDGAVLVAASSSGSNPKALLLRFNADGSFDTGFASGGIASVAMTAATEITDLVEQANGKVMLLGNLGAIGGRDILLIQFNADGSLDTTFGSNGLLTIDLGSDEQARTLAQQADGKWLIGGSDAGAAQAISLRLFADGSLDPSYGNNGLYRHADSSGNALTLQADGQLLLAGSLSNAGNTDALTLRQDMTPASADVGISKTLNTAGPYVTGQTVKYTLQVSNQGPDPAQVIRLQDTPSNLTINTVNSAQCNALPCTLALAGGSSETITVTASINAAGAFDNTAKVSGEYTDSNFSNDTDASGNGGTAADPSYTVGGTLSGLDTGKSVTLQNNGGDDLTLTGNGAFTFATALLSGSGYSVTVSMQPQDQFCAVSNGSGTIGNGNITNVAVDCIANQAPQPQSQGDFYSIPAGQLFNLDLNSQFIEPDNDTMSFNLLSGPGWLAVNASNLAGTPQNGDIRPRPDTVQVEASDPYGATGTLQMQLRVIDGNEVIFVDEF